MLCHVIIWIVSVTPTFILFFFYMGRETNAIVKETRGETHFSRSKERIRTFSYLKKSTKKIIKKGKSDPA